MSDPGAMKSSCYVVVFPDGTSGRKTSFKVDCDDAFAAIYEQGGKWYIAGISATRDAIQWSKNIVPARKEVP